MAIDPVVDHDILHASAQIDDGAQFFLQLLIRMLHLEIPAHRLWGIQNIPPVSRYNIIAGSPDQRDILYDDLAAHLIS